jgi:hypothetical protein
MFIPESAQARPTLQRTMDLRSSAGLWRQCWTRGGSGVAVARRQEAGVESHKVAIGTAGEAAGRREEELGVAWRQPGATV